MPSLIIVIPCFDEERRLDPGAFEQFAREHPHVQFLFVDDGSRDGTLSMLQAMHQRDPVRMHVHVLPSNRGKAEAVRLGMIEACARRPRFVAFLDADLATPLPELLPFLEVLERRPEIQMVFGSRVNLLGRSVKRNLLRHYVGRVFATTAAAALGLPIYDTQCGAKMFRATDWLLERLHQPFLSKWIFDVELIAREVQARRHVDAPPARQVVYEQPLMVWRDVKGSKIKPRDFVTVAIDLMRIYWRYLRPGAKMRRPAGTPSGSEPAGARPQVIEVRRPPT